MSSARAMVEKGLVNYGWTYINIDDGWQGIRGGKYNAIQPNSKFPAMQQLADSLHAWGLKLGIYSGPWVGTYAGHVGSYSDNPDGTYDWIKEGKHEESAFFTYFDREIGVKTILAMRKMKNGGPYKPYAIIDQYAFEATVGELQKGTPL